MYKKSTILKSLRANLTKGNGVYKACKLAGIGYGTLWSWKNKWPRIERYLSRVLECRTQLVEDALFNSALKGSNYAQIFWLKNRGTNWKDTPLVDMSQHTHMTMVKNFLIKAEEIDSDGRIKSGNRKPGFIESPA